MLCYIRIMPYINKLERPNILDCPIGEFAPEDAGELQFVIATLIHNYHKRFGIKYQKCNDIMGALAGAQMEYYRQVVAPYEDTKISSNG